MKSIAGALLLSLIVPVIIFPQSAEKPSVRFMFYNVENLFDSKDDTLKEDEEFLSAGAKRWTYSRYQSKINTLYKVIISAGIPDPPAIIGLCEVENKNVLQYLISSTSLSRFSYSVIHEESDDPRGIDVCMLYRNDIMTLAGFRYIYPAALRAMEVRTRSILYAKMVINNDTLHFLLNHWPSRRGGVVAGERSRKIISQSLRQLADSISQEEGRRSRIIIAGDFNAVPADDEIIALIKGNDSSSGAGLLVNLADRHEMAGRGTYKFRGTWELIDQIIVTGYLISNREGLYTQPGFFKIHDQDFLLVSDNVYTGKMPFSTYRGYAYQGGYSDHLPVILDFFVK